MRKSYLFFEKKFLCNKYTLNFFATQIFLQKNIFKIIHAMYFMSRVACKKCFTRKIFKIANAARVVAREQRIRATTLHETKYIVYAEV